MNTPYVDYDPCGRPKRRDGTPCLRRPIPGGVVCVKHGGRLPTVRDKAQRTLATAKLEKKMNATLAHEGLAPVEDPLFELGKLASSSREMMLALGKRMNALGDPETFDAKRAPQIRVVAEMYERSIDRTQRLLDSLVKHGYTERQVQLAEAEALLVAGVIRRVLQGLGLTPEQTEKAGTLLAEEFRNLESSSK